jgi:RNA polymerase sigma-70 factor (sigma-E family)
MEEDAAQALGGPGVSVPAGRDRAGAAVTALFREHHLELVRLALVMTGDMAAAEDAVQDAFERLYRRWTGLRNVDNLPGYARSAVLNRCRSAHRRAAVARKHLPALAPAGRSPDIAVQATEDTALLAALRTLPRRQREVLVLRYYCDLDAAEVAAALRITPGAVRSNAARGLARLARTMRED